METITRFEKTRLISARSLQLSLGAPPLVKPPKDASMREIAFLELHEKVLPLVVLRKLPNGEIQKIKFQ